MQPQDLNGLINRLKAFQSWRRGEDDRTMHEAGIDPKKVGIDIDTAINQLEMYSRAAKILERETK